MRNRILFVATRPIYPMKDGRTYLIEQYCDILNKLGYEVSLACFNLEEKQPIYLKNIYNMEEPKLKEKIWNVIVKSFLLHKWPIQTSLSFSKETYRSFLEFVTTIEPDILICDMARLVPYVENIKKYKILDMDDLLSKRYFRQFQNNNLNENVLGQYKNKLPRFMINIVVKLKLMKYFLVFEGKLMQKYELQVGKIFDKVFFCSPVDADEYNKCAIRKADCVHVAAREKENMRTEYDCKLIAFTGNVDIAANKDALIYLIENILSLLNSKQKQYKLLVVGHCSVENRKQFEKFDQVIVMGTVADIDEYLKRCVALVAPIQYGSGIKIKIIEAMALGIPVVTNRLGIEGLTLEPNQDAIICNTPEEYSNAINKLAEDIEYRKIISERGRKYIKENHSYERCMSDLKKILF